MAKTSNPLLADDGGERPSASQPQMSRSSMLYSAISLLCCLSGHRCCFKIFCALFKYGYLLSMPILLFIGTRYGFSNHQTLAFWLALLCAIVARIAFHFIATSVGTVFTYAKDFCGVYGTVIYIYTGCFLGFAFVNYFGDSGDVFNLKARSTLFAFLGVLLLPIMEFLFEFLLFLTKPLPFAGKVAFCSCRYSRDERILGWLLLLFYFGVVSAFISIYSLLFSNSDSGFCGLANLILGFVGCLLLCLFLTTQFFSNPHLFFEIPNFPIDTSRFTPRASSFIICIYLLMFIFPSIVPSSVFLERFFTLGHIFGFMLSVLVISAPLCVFYLHTVFCKRSSDESRV